MGLWLWALTAVAADVTPIVAVRPRVEAHTGRDGSPQGQDVFVSQRARLGVHAEHEGVKAAVVLQDVRTWGEEAHTLFDANADRLDLAQGWLSINLLNDSALRIGRQTLSLHEERLVGGVDWTQQGRAFDALALTLGKTGLNGEAAFAVLSDPSDLIPPAPVNTTPRPTGEFLLVRGGYASDERVIDGVYLFNTIHADDDAVAVDSQLHTGGVYTRADEGLLALRAEAYAQVGKRGDVDARAYLVGLAATVQPDVAGNPKATLWFDHLSGDADPTDAVNTAFDTLFDTRHKFYGRIDVFNFGVGGLTDGRGLDDLALKLEAKPTEAFKLFLDAHLFLAAAPQGGDRVLGEEVDAWASVKLAKPLTLSAGAAVLFRPALSADAWGYTMLEAAL